MSIETNKALVRRYFDEALNGKNLNVVAEVFAPDAVYTIAGLPEPVHGPDPIAQSVKSLITGFPDIQMRIEALIGEDDQVVVRYTGRGTHQGELLGIPATGKQAFLTGIAMYRVAEGRIVAGWDSADILGLLGQLGAFGGAPSA